MAVEVVYASLRDVFRAEVTWREGLTVEQALNAVSDQPGFADPGVLALPAGVFGEVVQRDAVLSDGDRVELYRPLERDPKEARRARAGG